MKVEFHRLLEVKPQPVLGGKEENFSIINYPFSLPAPKTYKLEKEVGSFAYVNL